MDSAADRILFGGVETSTESEGVARFLRLAEEDLLVDGEAG